MSDVELLEAAGVPEGLLVFGDKYHLAWALVSSLQATQTMLMACMDGRTPVQTIVLNAAQKALDNLGIE